MKQCAPFFVLLTLGFLTIAENGNCGNPKIDLLEQKKREIDALRESVNEKRIRAEGIRKQLRSNIKELTNEIASEKEKRGVKTFKQASEHPRIEFNLKLLQRLCLYAERLSGKIAYLENAENELAYWQMMTDDDLKIFRAMSDMDIDNLLTGVDGVLKTHRFQSGGKLINLRDTAVKTPQEIWNEMLGYGGK